MKSYSKPYFVRGFDVTAGGFDSRGSMESQPHFVEKVVRKQHNAVVALLTALRPMSAHNVAEKAVALGLTTVRGFKAAADDVEELHVVDIKVETHANSPADLRRFRKDLVEVLKTWSEKCRSKGSRGWRASAVRAPTIQTEDAGDVTIRTQAILSSAVFYNPSRATINFPETVGQAADDLAELKKHVQKLLGGDFASLSFNHSKFGRVGQV